MFNLVFMNQALASFGTVLPVPSDYMADLVAAKIVTYIYYVLNVAVIPYLFYRVVKKQDWVPILLWLGGFICSFSEATLDIPTHLWWPTNLPGPLYQAYGVNIPYFVPLAYAFNLSMVSYFIYRWIERGVTVKKFFYLWIAITVIYPFLEFPATHTGVYKYYGDQPFMLGGFACWQSWTNVTGFIFLAFLLWLFNPMLQGWKKVVILFLPVFGLLGGWGMVAWPNFIALNFHGPFGEFSHNGKLLLSTFSLVLCLIVAQGIAVLVATDSRWQIKHESRASKSS
jgi:hypothetical protein